ncbi:TolC family outer membrane protein [Ramlibacter ginsenosidimutans]|uniref:TolC family outer membrane protein n=1 Tax=Ramlibacter ginsenosidimutans TaxID=502333 RepID=A0A934WPS4_9BURK|nr:TolC family outer membrane protein [Ramlibacter ginsenosidimutans]MBK6008841.1 TolC family outer membrane protein [Ramlibacter ginsenosidimutans]
MKKLRLAPLAAAIGLALAGAAHAEGLLEMYEDARAYDATWQSAKAQYDANLYRAEQAKAGILPQAGLTANAGRSKIEVNAPPLPSSHSYGTESATLSASQPLYRPANLATWRQAERQKQQAEYQLTAASQDLIIRVSQAYFDVLAAQDTLTFVRAQKEATAEQLASAKRNFEVGTTTITDTREAQARYDLVLAQEIQAENDLRIKRLALDTLVGKPGAMPDPVGTLDRVPPPQPADPEAWVAASESASPPILQAKSNVEIAELETEKARAGHKPTVDLTASYGWAHNINGTATSFLDNAPRQGTAGIAINVPLFSGFAVQNRIRETLALEEKARTDLEATRRQVAQAVRTAYFGVVSGQGQVRALEAAEASSQSSLDANRLGYQVGVRINIDVLNAQTQLFQTKRDLSQARYNVLLGHLKLRQANGTLQAEDLTRLNTLLQR